MLNLQDCDKVVAQKFFPIEDGDAQYPLCERDYFARLHLICAKCDQALRSSYITACGEFEPQSATDKQARSSMSSISLVPCATRCLDPAIPITSTTEKSVRIPLHILSGADQSQTVTITTQSALLTSALAARQPSLSSLSRSIAMDGTNAGTQNVT